MSHPVPMQFQAVDLEKLATATGRIAVLVGADAKMGAGARRLNKLMRGALNRAVESEAFTKLKPGEAMDMAYPAGIAADVVQLVRLEKRCDVATARKAGAAIGKSLAKDGTLVLVEGHSRAAELSFGLALRAYDFNAHKTAATNRTWPCRADGGQSRGGGFAGQADGGGGRRRVLHPRSGQ